MEVNSRYRLSNRNFRQGKTSKHTVNVNELGTYALPGSCRFRISIFSGAALILQDFGAKFCTYLLTYLLTYKHTNILKFNY